MQALSERITRQQLRWLAIGDCVMLVRELWEPARYMKHFTHSWAAKVSGYAYVGPDGMWLWLIAAACLVVPLMGSLLLAPHSRVTRWAIPPACGGLFLGGFAFLYLAALASQHLLDAEQVIDSYRWSAGLLMVHGLLIACWVNARQVERDWSEKTAAKGATACAAAPR